jgi:predicted ATPase
MEAAVAERAASGVPASDVLQELNDVADPVIVSQSTGACALWLLGRPDEATATSARAVAAARRFGHPFTIALALYFQALLWRFIRQPKASTARAAEALAYAREQELVFWAGWSGVLHGAGLVTDGEVDAGVAAIREGLVVWQATGSRFFTSVYLAFLAEGLTAQGRREEALDTLEEARRFAVETGERLWLPEIHRLRGELLAASPGSTARDEAEGELLTALELARRGEASALEQRARASLDALRGTRPTARPGA